MVPLTLPEPVEISTCHIYPQAQPFDSVHTANLPQAYVEEHSPGRFNYLNVTPTQDQHLRGSVLLLPE